MGVISSPNAGVSMGAVSAERAPAAVSNTAVHEAIPEAAVRVSLGRKDSNAEVYHPSTMALSRRDRCGCAETEPSKPADNADTRRERLSADYDGDGKLNIFDFLAFQNGYAAGDKRTDYNGDGLLDIRDFEMFRDIFKRQTSG